jgi:dipeptidase D
MPLDIFRQIASIPRPSRQEDKISDWLQHYTLQRGARSEFDKVGNLLVHIEARGRQRSAPIILQGHMDMVCEKRPESRHNFSTDPLNLIEDGDWLRADNTTLGADNGVALAMALALLDDPDAIYPELELLFTTDEETGLTGAQNLQPDWLRGDTLINLDSEEEGVFIVGCAGGKETRISLNLEPVKAPEGKVYRLNIAGLPGGHSGVDIHRPRANAIKILARTLDTVLFHAHLLSFHGGTAHNAIPRDAHALLLIEAREFDTVYALVNELGISLADETGAQLSLREEEGMVARNVFSVASSRQLVNLLLALPHGVAGMLGSLPHIVETSTNLAQLGFEGALAKILTTQRSAVTAKLHAHTRSIEAIAELAGADVSSGNEYSPWQPLGQSPLVNQCGRIYQQKFGNPPHIEVIHAGLECGVISQTYPGLEMISFGPTIQNAHSPDERLHMPSLERVYSFLKAVLREV